MPDVEFGLSEEKDVKPPEEGAPESSTDEKDEKHEEISQGKEEEEVVPKEHYDNLLKALKETRGMSKAEIESLRQRVGMYEDKLTALESAKSTKDIKNIFKDVADDDYVSVAGVKKVIEELLAAMTTMQNRNEQERAVEAINAAEDRFRDSHKDFDEVVAPYRDLLRDKDFVKELLRDGPSKAPQRFYDYAKGKQSPDEIETRVRKELTEKLTQVKKPGTMDQKSRAGHSKKKLSEYTLEDKRKMSKKELDAYWEALCEEEERAGKE